MLKRLVTIIPWIVSLVGLIVAFGWLIDSRFIVQISSSYTSMKFITAFLFLVCGFQLMNMRDLIFSGNVKKDKTYITLLAISFVVIIISLAINISPGLFEGLLNLSLTNPAYDPWTTIPHLPSIATLFSFLVISSAQVMIIFFSHKIKTILLISGIVLSIIGSVAIVGYLFSLPILFYTTISGGGMAIHSALLFVSIGLFFTCLSRKCKNIL